MRTESTSMTARLIAIDWGTSSFRAALADGEGTVLERCEKPQGILAAEGRFADVLREAIAPWRQLHPDLPILMCGMIGSRQGWHEVPYVHCPATLASISAAVTMFEEPGIGAIGIVPGVDVRTAGNAPDVMRGEETQILGAIAQLGLDTAICVHPGTHAKWVRVENRTIAGFETFMTGEVYAALRGHTILGRMMSDGAFSEAGFRRGLEASAENGAGPGALLHRIFSTRTQGLFGELDASESADYLSGLLIGSEMREGLRRGAQDLVILGAHDLEARYRMAADHLGVRRRIAPPDCAVAGLLAIARTAGLIGNTP